MTNDTPIRRGRYWHFADGTILPVVSGGDGAGDGGGGGGDGGQGGNPPTPPPPAASEAKFTQADLDKIAGNARKDGREAGLKEVLESLGVADVDAAKALVEAAKAAEDAQKSELQKATEERDKFRQQAEQAQARAEAAVAITRLEGALRDAGINAERIPAAMKLADLSGLKVEGTDVSGVAEAVESIKATSPEWFKPGAPAKAPDASGGSSGEDPDYRNAPKEEVAKVLFERYGIR